MNGFLPLILALTMLRHLMERSFERFENPLDHTPLDTRRHLDRQARLPPKALDYDPVARTRIDMRHHARKPQKRRLQP